MNIFEINLRRLKQERNKKKQIKQQEDKWYMFQIKNLDQEKLQAYDRYSFKQTFQNNNSYIKTSINQLQESKLISILFNQIDKFTMNVIKQMVYNNQIDINYRDLNQNSLLHLGVLFTDLNFVQLLIQKNIIYNQNKKNQTPLHLSINNQNIQICKIIIDKFNKSTLLSFYDDSFNNIFHYAVLKKNKQIIIALKKLNNKHKNIDGKTPYQLASPQIKQILNELQPIELSLQKFKIVKFLGQGSFGHVFLSQLQKKFYALKQIKKPIKSYLKNYIINQKEFMMKANCPFIIKLYGCFQTSKAYYFVQQYCQNSLQQKIGKISQLALKKYAAEIVIALQYIHASGFIYRDLKPANILIDIQGHIKIIDFGLCCKGSNCKLVKSFCGSLSYLAPQIYLGRGYSYQVDWYSLGILLYEIMQGNTPFYQSETQMQKKLNLQNYSRDLNNLIKRLIEKQPEKRLGSIKGSQQIKNHQWFRDINFEKVKNRQLQMIKYTTRSENINTTYINCDIEKDIKFQNRDKLEKFQYNSL